MKNLLITLIFAALATASIGQSYQAVDTIQPTAYKHKIITEKLTKLVQVIEQQTSKEKGAGEIIYKEETAEFFTTVINAYNNYTASLLIFDTLTYEKIGIDYYLNGDTTQTGIITEFFSLQTEIKKIDDDDEITYKDAVSGIKRKRLKQRRLRGLYNQLKK